MLFLMPISASGRSIESRPTMTDESDENADQHDVLQLPLAAEDYVTVELEGGRLVDTVLVSPGDGDCAMTAYFSEPSSVDPVCIGGASGSENEAEAISIGSDCGSGVTQSWCVTQSELTLLNVLYSS